MANGTSDLPSDVSEDIANEGLVRCTMVLRRLSLTPESNEPRSRHQGEGKYADVCTPAAMQRHKLQFAQSKDLTFEPARM